MVGGLSIRKKMTEPPDLPKWDLMHDHLMKLHGLQSVSVSPVM